MDNLKIENASIETNLHLNNFRPRGYQEDVIYAVEKQGYKKLLLNWNRRAGKDVAAFNIMIRSALRKIGLYLYCLPTYNQGRKVLWDGILSDGTRFLSFIPKELIANKNNSEMKLTLINGSIIQVVGSDTASQTLVGTNPQGIVFSEWSRSEPSSYTFLRPALVYNNAWVIFASTPFGKNHMYEMDQIARHNPKEWFSSLKTIVDTKVISLEDIEKEKAEGLISDDLIQQEYFGSYEAGAEGSYYAKYIQKMLLDGRLGDVPWEPSFKVHSAWDLGVHDKTTIIMFSCVGQIIRILDYYENCDKGLDHYVKVLQEKPYLWGNHFAPHDIAVRELSTGLSRIELARRMGINFKVLPNIPVEDGIELAKTTFPKLWIDGVKCAKLIKALENYRREWDPKKKVYQQRALHDDASHACFTGDTLILTRNGMRPIMEIQDNDIVLTLKGWKPCKKSWVTRNAAKVMEVRFQDGTIVKCTPDHKFLMDNAWIYAEHLMKGMQIQSSLMNEPKNSMDILIDYGIKKDILLDNMDTDYTKTYGNMLLEICLKIVTFIIKIITAPITILKTLNAFLKKYIFINQTPIPRVSVKNVEKPLLNGMVLNREDYGIKNMPYKQKHGLNGNEKQKSVYIVEKNIQGSLEKQDVSKNSVIPIAKPLIIESVRSLEIKEDVWCLEVPEIGHFSLSNGAVVKNSDAFRYLCMSLNKCRDGLTPEQLDARYAEAMYGTNNGVPKPFQEKYF